MRALKLCITLGMAFGVFAGMATADDGTNVLFLNKSAGFEHSVIRLKDDGTTHTGEIMKRACREHGRQGDGDEGRKPDQCGEISRTSMWSCSIRRKI